MFNCFLRGPVYSRHYACAILLCGKWCVHQYLSLVEKCVSHEIGGGINTGVVLVSIRMFEWLFVSETWRRELHNHEKQATSKVTLVQRRHFYPIMKEMVGGCCVCSDERGWAENPLVYCDGQGCTVAVHQGKCLEIDALLTETHSKIGLDLRSLDLKTVVKITERGCGCIADLKVINSI